MATWYNVEFHTHGILRKKFEVPANAVRGLQEIPDFEECCKQLPARVWPALQRGSWWSDKYSPSLPMRCDLKDKRGQNMGTLFAVVK